MERVQGLFILILFFWILPTIIKAAKRKQQNQKNSGQNTQPAAQRQTPSVELHRPAPSMNRSAHRQFSAPEAPCIVCENTGDDHFQRDKARRIAQLDDWLKNGLIDRDEYRVMKDRYERGI